MAFRFIPEIQLGHIIQAAAVIVTIGGGAIGAYWSMDRRISLIEIAVQSSKELDTQWRNQVKDYMHDTSTSLGSISRDISDLRVGLASSRMKIQ